MYWLTVFAQKIRIVKFLFKQFIGIYFLIHSKWYLSKKLYSPLDELIVIFNQNAFIIRITVLQILSKLNFFKTTWILFSLTVERPSRDFEYR